MFKRLVQIVVIMGMAITMLGADDASTTRLDQIGHKLVCQCGCGQILMECNHVGCPVSGPMINELRSQLAAGSTEAAVLQNFINKYGPVVLAAPIRGGFDNVAWVVPYASFFLGLAGVVLLIVYWRRRGTVLRAGTAPQSVEPSSALRDRIRAETE